MIFVDNDRDKDVSRLTTTATITGDEGGVAIGLSIAPLLGRSVPRRLGLAKAGSPWYCSRMAQIDAFQNS